MSQTFPKYDRFKELQFIFKDLQPVPHQPKVTTIGGGGPPRKKYTGKVPSANFPSRIVPQKNVPEKKTTRKKLPKT